MSKQTMSIMIGYDDDGEPVHREVPFKMEVCERCHGHGTHLHPAIGAVAYSSEEFYREFDDEESRDAYFTRGGMYDVKCEECGGANVVAEPDYGALSHEDREMFEEYCDDMANDAAERASERRMGC